MLRGEVALVTGAARGIGAAVARRLAHDGLRIVLTDIRDAEGRATAAEISTETEYRRLDVREEAEWASVTTAIIEEYGRLDVLVNNAGITGFERGAVPHDPEHALLEDWHAVHRTDLDGVFLGCKYGIRAMRETGAGSIINISSRSGLVGIPSAAAYASSKAAVRNHTKTVALYCAGQGLRIRCNAVFPAAIVTPMWSPCWGPVQSGRRRCASSHERRPSGPVRHCRGGCRGGCLPGVGRRRLYHRLGVRARRGHSGRQCCGAEPVGRIGGCEATRGRRHVLADAVGALERAATIPTQTLRRGAITERYP